MFLLFALFNVVNAKTDKGPYNYSETCKKKGCTAHSPKVQTRVSEFDFEREFGLSHTKNSLNSTTSSMNKKSQQLVCKEPKFENVDWANPSRPATKDEPKILEMYYNMLSGRSGIMVSEIKSMMPDLPPPGPFWLRLFARVVFYMEDNGRYKQHSDYHMAKALYTLGLVRWEDIKHDINQAQHFENIRDKPRIYMDQEFMYRVGPVLRILRFLIVVELLEDPGYKFYSLYDQVLKTTPVPYECCLTLLEYAHKVNVPKDYDNWLKEKRQKDQAMRDALEGQKQKNILIQKELSTDTDTNETSTNTNTTRTTTDTTE